MLGTWIHGALQDGTEAIRQTAVEAAIVVGAEGETISIVSMENLLQCEVVLSSYKGLAR